MKSGSQTRAGCFTNSSMEGHHLFQGLFGRIGSCNEVERNAGGSAVIRRVTKPDRSQHRGQAESHNEVVGRTR